MAALLLDAYPLIALLRREQAADEVHRLLSSDRAAIPSVNLAEVLDLLGRVYGREETDLLSALEGLQAGGLEIVAMGRAEALRAAAVRRAHYRRRDSELSLADCFLVAAAGEGDAIATSDRPVARAARAQGIDVIALPDSRGRRP